MDWFLSLTITYHGVNLQSYSWKMEHNTFYGEFLSIYRIPWYERKHHIALSQDFLSQIVEFHYILMPKSANLSLANTKTYLWAKHCTGFPTFD